MNPNTPDSQYRPHWWPNNETWPPERHAAPLRGRALRRLGCALFLFIIGFSALLIMGFGLAARWFGYLRMPHRMDGPNLFPLVGLGLLFGFGLLWLAGKRLRGWSEPVGDVLETIQRVSDGDYSARVVARGPSEVRSLARAFNDMVARLEATSAQRQDLLADVTHELRTPLTVIRGNVEGMLDGVYPADEMHLRSILEEIDLLSRLVEDLRTLSLAESGALQLQKEPTYLAVLIGESAAAFRPQTDASEVALRVLAPEDASLVSLDARRMRQVFSNLIANALRYTPRGGWIEVDFHVLKEKEDLRAEIIIRDSGAGIAPEDLPHVFDRFYKTRDSGGRGLGLAIAKKLVEAHSGTIEAQSAVGEGTCMRILLPLDHV